MGEHFENKEMSTFRYDSEKHCHSCKGAASVDTYRGHCWCQDCGGTRFQKGKGPTLRELINPEFLKKIQDLQVDNKESGKIDKPKHPITESILQRHMREIVDFNLTKLSRRELYAKHRREWQEATRNLEDTILRLKIKIDE